ncbi:hypothetical protein CAter282_3016 [Collimonas arenae]|uniref:Uncharacterized protein n=1 Tax=Collimonas arenae TaxID=279058 RepID=A0A127PSP3_9BURK|nr:hypothetical protein CAter10_3320 [Collimonas arenae]AMP10733.1 hypothetical protein CAter282_3016 [Collimonas arenae]
MARLSVAMALGLPQSLTTAHLQVVCSFQFSPCVIFDIVVGQQDE